LFNHTAGTFWPPEYTNLTVAPVKSITAGADNRAAITVSPLTAKLAVALTRSPARKFEIALFNPAALRTATIRFGANEVRLPVKAMARL
jgi:hypothetical protein